MDKFDNLLNDYIVKLLRLPTASLTFINGDAEYQKIQRELNVAQRDLYHWVKVLLDHDERITGRFDQIYEVFGQRFEDEYGFEDE
jgi:hypothetical protein